MSQNTTSLLPSQTCIGVDLGDKNCHYCEIGEDASIVAQGQFSTSKDSFRNHFESRAGMRVVIETGTHCHWVEELLSELGCEVLIANARELPRIKRKNDQKDAELLARLGRHDPNQLKPITPRSLDSRRTLSQIRARHAMVKQATSLVNCIRGIAKSHGTLLKGCTGNNMHKTAPDQLPEDARLAVLPLITLLRFAKRQIREFDRKIEAIAKSCPQIQRLQQVRGVGALTATHFHAIVGDPRRFQDPRNVGAFIGLVPGQYQSGNRDPQLRISKNGDSILRSHLVQAAHYIMGPFGEPCELREFGERLVERGGGTHKKRAVVAVARKLSVLLLTLWRSGEDYDPFYAKNHSAKKTPQPRADGRTFMGRPLSEAPSNGAAELSTSE